MIYSWLRQPNSLEIDGKTYSAGDMTHLSKGDGQKLVKQYRKDGQDVEFFYREGKPKSTRRRRKADPKNDA